jgi:alpha-ketoglutarate-dependent taurine dioxygenase
MTRNFSLQPLPKSFGALITDIRLPDIDDSVFAELYAAWLDYALLIFPGQYLSDDEQRTFASRFGDLVEGLEAVEISNVLPNGELRAAPDDDMMKIIRGNMHWHQDNTYMPLQAKGAVFSAKMVPTRQGDTAFADMRAAYDALDENTREMIAQLSAHHSLVHSQKKIGEQTKDSDSEYIGYGLDVSDIPLRPLVKKHPETGRNALAVGRHAFGVKGQSEQASEKLLRRLNEFAVHNEHWIYQHQWSVGDVVVWDNRCLMHKACDWDFSEKRVMLHSRIAGDPISELAQPDQAPARR